MAFVAITDGQIQVDDPITQGLMQKIKDNFDYLHVAFDWSLARYIVGVIDVDHG